MAEALTANKTSDADAVPGAVTARLADNDLVVAREKLLSSPPTCAIRPAMIFSRT